MSIAMALTLNSDLLMVGYYSNYRSSFYGADSGLTSVRQEILNELKAAVNDSFATGTPPIANGTEATVLASVESKFGTSASAATSVNAASSYPEKFYIDSSTDPITSKPRSSLELTTCTVTIKEPTTGAITTTSQKGGCPSNVANATRYVNVYTYSLTAVGSSVSNQKVRLNDTGTITVDTAVGNSKSYKTSFAAWGTFLNINDICNAQLVGGTITGPQFTNGSWTFGQSQSYLFTDEVGSAGNKAGYYYKSGGCYGSASSSYKRSGVTIAPTFQKGFNRGQNAIALPSNDFNQKRAVVDGQGRSETELSNTEMHAALRDATGTKYPSTGASTGVYLPYTFDVNGNAKFTGGGILVEGNATVVLTASGSNAEIYTISQGTYTTTVTVDNFANTTSIITKSGTSTVGSQTISGVPTMYNSDLSVSGLGTMLYVDGNITALSGPGGSAAAIQDHTALTVTALNNIAITDNILYKTEPVAVTASGSTSASTLISGNDKGQALGIFTANGTVVLDPKKNGNNLEIDASIATTSQADSNTSSCDMSTICRGTISVANGNTIDTLTIVGGRIQNRAQVMPSGTIGTRNIIFDRRYTAGGFAPPFFPSTTVTELPGGTSYSNNVQAWASRVRWANQSTY